MNHRSTRGTSLIDLVISMAIVSLLFGGVYVVYFSIITAVSNISVRSAASTALGAELETIRNLPYDSVGIVSGIPSGVIPQTQTVAVGGFTFSLQTTVRNIDDPFDGTLGGSPNDTAPADYKFVSVQASCPLCQNFVPITITSTVAPKNLESATQNGTLFIYVLNANGAAIPDAVVNVVNASVTPSINLSDTTNASGVLQLVGVPTSTQNYQISVAKTGYSSDKNYPLGAAGNPNPVKPYSTVAAQTVTSVTFGIDHLSSVNVITSDNRCNAVGNEHFTIAGSKLIGTSPDVLKFSTSSATNGSGTVTLSNIEWDTYALALADAARDVAGTIPLSPTSVNPSSTQNFRFIVQTASDPALLITIEDAATGVGIAGAQVNIVKGASSQTLSTDHTTLTQTNWSGGQYSSKSVNMDTDSLNGEAILLVNASATYPTGTTEWLTSNTFDLGGSSSSLYALSWNPTSQPPQTGGGSLEFQAAANNDNATWNFVGPDGTAGTFFTVSSTLPAGLSGNRYFRYKAYMTTQSSTSTPELDDVSLDFSADCVPPAQVLFNALAQGNYTATVSAPNYETASTTLSVGSGFQSSTILLTHS